MQETTACVVLLACLYGVDRSGLDNKPPPAGSSCRRRRSKEDNTSLMVMDCTYFCTVQSSCAQLHATSAPVRGYYVQQH